MDNEQIESLISQLKGVGLDDEKILDVFYEAFQKGKMDRKDLETLADKLGYELDDDFKEDKTPDPIAGGDKEDAPADLAEKAEELKEIKPGESKEEFKEKAEDAAGEFEEEEDIEEDKDEDDGDEEDDEEEWKEANKYFKI